MVHGSPQEYSAVLGASDHGPASPYALTEGRAPYVPGHMFLHAFPPTWGRETDIFVHVHSAVVCGVLCLVTQAEAAPSEAGGRHAHAAQGISDGMLSAGSGPGAGVGATADLIQQAGKNQQAAQAQAGSSNYDRAYAACMQGRGDQVR